MKVYVVGYHSQDVGGSAVFCGSKAQVAKVRKRLIDGLDKDGLDDLSITVSLIDVTPTKDGMLRELNRWGDNQDGNSGVALSLYFDTLEANQ